VAQGSSAAACVEAAASIAPQMHTEVIFIASSWFKLPAPVASFELDDT
jgi:hypothetical protein